MADLLHNKLLLSIYTTSSRHFPPSSFPLFLSPSSSFSSFRFITLRPRVRISHSSVLVKLSNSSTQLDIISAAERSDGSVVFKFGDACEIQEKITYADSSDAKLEVIEVSDNDCGESDANDAKAVIEEASNGKVDARTEKINGEYDASNSKQEVLSSSNCEQEVNDTLSLVLRTLDGERDASNVEPEVVGSSDIEGNGRDVKNEVLGTLEFEDDAKSTSGVNEVNLEIVSATDAKLAEVDDVENEVKLEIESVNDVKLAEVDDVESGVKLEIESVGDVKLAEVDDVENGVNLQIESVSDAKLAEVDDGENGVKLQKESVSDTKLAEVHDFVNEVKLETDNVSDAKLVEVDYVEIGVKSETESVTDAKLAEIDDVENEVNSETESVSDAKLAEGDDTENGVKLQTESVSDAKLAEVHDFENEVKLETESVSHAKRAEVNDVENGVKLETEYVGSAEFLQVKDGEHGVNGVSGTVVPAVDKGDSIQEELSVNDPQEFGETAKEPIAQVIELVGSRGTSDETAGDPFGVLQSGAQSNRGSAEDEHSPRSNLTVDDSIDSEMVKSDVEVDTAIATSDSTADLTVENLEGMSDAEPVAALSTSQPGYDEKESWEITEMSSPVGTMDTDVSLEAGELESNVKHAVNEDSDSNEFVEMAETNIHVETSNMPISLEGTEIDGHVKDVVNNESYSVELVPQPALQEAEPVLDKEASFYSVDGVVASQSNLAAKTVNDTTPITSALCDDDPCSGDNLEAPGSAAAEITSTETDLDSSKISTPVLSISSAAVSLPHPSEALTGGEDAYFVGENWFGVAEGVNQWSLEGTNEGNYAHDLMQNCQKLASNTQSDGLIDVKEVLRQSATMTKSTGSARILIAHFANQALHVANIGDSGFVIIRNGAVFKKSSPMFHEFHFPCTICSGDDPQEAAEEYHIDLEGGDVIITATDGLFDNLYEQEIASIVSKSMGAGMEPKDLAELLAVKAQEVGRSASARSPFADAAQAAGHADFSGGKLDHMTVIVSLVQKQ